MRAQYHFRNSPEGMRAWNVHRLVELSDALVRERVPLSAFRELDEPYWSSGEGQKLTCREVADHARLILESDLAFPIILSSDGRIMDGMHRVCKALMNEMKSIKAFRLAATPEPDFVGIPADQLPY